MQTKTKVLSISTLVSAALFLTLSAAQAANGAKTAKIEMNGDFADTFLVDGNTNGGLTASKDQVANTSALDFSYGTPDPTTPDTLILIQGAGAIPNSTLTINSTTAHLVVTVSNSDSYILNRCLINLVIGSFECAPATPKTFDLSWEGNGWGTVDEKITRVETIGPVTTKFKGTFTSETANSKGKWDGHLIDSTGSFVVANLRNTQNTTVTREITVEPNP